MGPTRRLWTLGTLGICACLLGPSACGSSGDGASARGGGGSGGGGGATGGAGGGAAAAGSGGQAVLPPSGISCTSDAECGPPWPYCDAEGGECVQCLTSDNCGGSACDPTTHTCEGGAPETGPVFSGGPRFPGSGSSAGIPLQPGFGPETADDCPPADGLGTSEATQVRDSATLCFYGEDDTPAAAIEQVIEVVAGVEYIHLRVTFNPEFADNTFGEGSVGWDGVREFDKLVGSDHLELLLTDCSGATVMQFKVDYVSEDPDSPSGYGTLGVTGGDGQMTEGDPEAVLGAATSIDRNLNGCGYSDYVADSPATDESFVSNSDTPNWDYRVVYEVWVDASAFDQCFGQAYLESVHASPAKTQDSTILVEGAPCPPEWDTPYCVNTTESGCDNTTDSPCPQNFTTFADCPTECVPVPFAGYEGRAACPAGYTLDLASEGQYCVPETGEVCP